MVNWNRIFVILSIIISIVALIISVISLSHSKRANEISERSAISYLADIEVKWIDDYNYFYVNDLIDNSKINNLNFIYANRGRGYSGGIDIYLWDKDWTYGPLIKSGSLNPFSEEINFERFGIDITPSLCTNSNTSCEKPPINTGLFEWYLKVDCPYCDQKEECYSFKVCFIDTNFSAFDCKKMKDYSFDLVKLKECPPIKPYIKMGEHLYFY